jgi:hypothetical protein
MKRVQTLVWTCYLNVFATRLWTLANRSRHKSTQNYISYTFSITSCQQVAKNYHSRIVRKVNQPMGPAGIDD